MNVSIKKSLSENDINAIYLRRCVNQPPEAKKPNSSKAPLFHGWHTSNPQFPPPITMPTFRLENETTDPCTLSIQTRPIKLQTSSLYLTSTECEPRDAASPINTVNTTYQRRIHDTKECSPEYRSQQKNYNLSGVHQHLLTAESSPTLPPQNIRNEYGFNRHSLRPANHILKNDGSERPFLMHKSWWERSAKWNPVLIVGTLAVAGVVSGSLISDIMKDGDDTLLQRSGAVMICWTALFGFIDYMKRREKSETFEIVPGEIRERLSREEYTKLMPLNEDIESARLIVRKVKGSSGRSEWIMLFTSIIGTLIWGYGDLFFKK